MQRTLTVLGWNTVKLVSSLTRLDSATSFDTKNNLFFSLVKSNLVERETSCTLILTPRVSVFVPMTKVQNTILYKYFSRYHKHSPTVCRAIFSL